MRKKEGTSEDYILSSGRIISPNMCIIGIDEDGEIHEGYDSTLETDYDEELADKDDDYTQELTPEEKSEIAQEMIRRWATLLIVPVQY